MESAPSNTHTAMSQHKYGDFRLLYLIMQMIGAAMIILMLSWVFVHLGGLSWSSTPDIQFNWHPLLMTIGMVYLYGNSILIYRGLRYTRKRTLKISHASIFGTIMILVLFASWAVYDSHVLKKPNPIPNLYSLHSWVGLAAVLLFVLQWLCGFFSFLYPIIPPQQRENVMPYHVYFGVTGYVLAIAAALMGLNEKAFFRLPLGEYSNLPNEAMLINTIGILMVLFAGIVLYLATNKHFRRQPLPEDAILLTGHDE